MSGWIRRVLLVVATLPALASTASAVQFDVEYDFAFGSNTSSFLGGADPVSGTFTIRWTVDPNPLFATGPATLIDAVVLISGSGTATLPAWGAPLIPLRHNRAAFYGPFSGHPTFTGGSVYGGSDGQYAYAYWLSPLGAFQLVGAEVSRTIVPEPGSGLLLVAGVGWAILAGLPMTRVRRARASCREARSQWGWRLRSP